MSEPQGEPALTQPPTTSRAWIGWLIAIIVVAGLAVAWWIASRPSEPPPTTSPTPSPSVTPSASPSASPSVAPSPDPTPTESVATASLLDADGRWCPTSPADWGDVCVTVALPEIAREDPGSEPMYVYPPEHEPGADPSTFDFTFASNAGECWSAVADGFPSESGIAFYYCPAGAVSGEAWIDGNEHADQDRIYMTSEETEYPYLRAD